MERRRAVARGTQPGAVSEAPLFLDTSALLRAYLTREPYSRLVLEQMQAANLNVVSRLSHLETYSALTQRQHRDHAARLGPAQVRVLLADFERDWETLAVVELSAGVMARAASLIRSHSEAGLRSLDAIHLACALEAREVWASVEVLTFDTRQAEVARTLGLNVLPLPPESV